jgi:MFS transporter, ACDE family, multidrug resistance protein
MHVKRKTPLYAEKNLRIIFSITLIAVLGVASITPAFPRMQEALHTSAEQIGLLITVFTLPGVFLAPALGVMADRYGRKRILVPSLLLFGVAGVLCGVIHSFHYLLLFRFFQGIGAASLGSLNATLIGDLYSGKERTAAMGYNASVLSIGTASYPAIGGMLAMFGWYFPFFLPALALPVGFVVLFSLDNPEPNASQSLGLYLRATLKSLANRRVTGLLLASVATFILIYGSYLTYFPFLVEERFSAPPYVIGLLMSSMSLTTAVTASQLGRLSRRFTEVSLFRFAFVLYAISLLLIPFFGNIYLLLVPLVIFGVAQGLNLPSIQTLLAGLAPIEYRGAFMSLNGMALRTGQTIGPVLMGMVYTMGGIGAVYYAGAAVSLLMLAIAIAMVRPAT